MNWSSLVTSVVAIILIVPLVDFTEPPLHFVCFVPILVYAIYVAFAKQKSFVDTAKRPLGLNDIWKLFLLNFFLLALYCLLLVPILKLLPYIHSWIAVSWFFFLVQNTDLSSPSYKLLHLHIDNETLIQKLSILLLNFLKYLFMYIVLIADSYGITQEVKQNVLTYVLFIATVNLASRFMIFKDTSLLERFLRIKPYKYEAKGDIK
ncbi:MAG: hypothetical protein U0I22_10735 [Treponema sp.]|nr:hypothetical protein [Treponema sp.]